MDVIQNVINFVKAHWVEITVVYLAFAKFVTAIRDVLDKTPQSDDTLFERIVTVINKLGGYLLAGKRPS